MASTLAKPTIIRSVLQIGAGDATPVELSLNPITQAEFTTKLVTL